MFRVGPSNWAWLSPEDSGVGETQVRYLQIDFGDGVTKDAIPLAAGTRNVALLRHPALKTTSKEKLIDAANKLRESDFYQAYSRMSRLADAVEFHPVLRESVRLALTYLDTVEPGLVHGAFCSELVGKYFALLQVPLFDDFRSPETISPNRLFTNSLLRDKSEDALIYKHSIPDGASGVLINEVDDFLKRQVALRLMVRVKSMESTAREILDKARVTGGGQLIDFAREQFEWALKHARHAQELQDARATRSIGHAAYLWFFVFQIQKERFRKFSPSYAREHELKANFCKTRSSVSARVSSAD